MAPSPFRKHPLHQRQSLSLAAAQRCGRQSCCECPCTLCLFLLLFLFSPPACHCEPDAPLSLQMGGSGFTAPGPAAPAGMGAPLGSGLGDLFDLTGGVGTLSGSYVAPKTVSGTAALRWRAAAALGREQQAPRCSVWVNLCGCRVSAQVWLPAMKAKGLEISGTFSRQVGAISMDLVLTNKALQVMSDFAIQFNRNR